MIELARVADNTIHMLVYKCTKRHLWVPGLLILFWEQDKFWMTWRTGITLLLHTPPHPNIEETVIKVTKTFFYH